MARSKLSVLARRINAEHRAAKKGMRDAVVHAIAAGRLLCKAQKQVVHHGDWLPWLEKNFTGSARTAQGYMRVAREFPKLSSANTQRVAHLPLRRLLEEIAEPRTVTVEVRQCGPLVPSPAPPVQYGSGALEILNRNRPPENRALTIATVPVFSTTRSDAEETREYVAPLIDDHIGYVAYLRALAHHAQDWSADDAAASIAEANRQGREKHIDVADLEELSAWVAGVASALGNLTDSD